MTDTRPDLGFITANRFETMDEFLIFTASLDKEQMKVIINCIIKIPELVSITEQAHDQNKHGRGLGFEIVQTVLKSLIV